MKTYYIHDGEFLLRSVTCLESMLSLQIRDGEFAQEGNPPGYNNQLCPYVGARWSIKQNCWVDTRSEAEKQAQAAEDIAFSRRSSYPSIGDQLDMLWHAMDQEVIPRVEPFYSEIKAVKDKYPKLANNP